MLTPRGLAMLLVMLAMSLGSLGCGGRGDQPEVGRVRGTVTLDGQPLSGVIVRFFPATGRAATATTDDHGSYELIYTYGVDGAKVGANTVSFAWPDGEPGAAKIPAKYGANSELQVTVEPGKNTFDFSLESK